MSSAPESLLSEEAILLEYQASENLEDRHWLYENRQFLRRYWERERWLKLDFERGEPCVRARHFVGLMPFRGSGRDHLIMVAPKGCDPRLGNPVTALLRFLELVAIANGQEPIESEEGFSGRLGRQTFLTFLALHYSRLIQNLCRNDFRCYFQPVEDHLHCRIKGRINVSRHVRNAMNGRGHRIPCRWEEFTPDNWDNRILLAAMRRLEHSASFLGSDARRYISGLFTGLEAWFASVEHVAVGPVDFNKARLWRTSDYYRRTIFWARLIIAGLSRPVASGEAPPLMIDANETFERFAAVVTRAAIDAIGDRKWNLRRRSFRFFRGGPENRDPDLTITEKERTVAVGDAKYKDVLDQTPSGDRLDDLRKAIVPRISAPDWNQLYVYMRITTASHGFFVVPYWNSAAAAAELIPDFEVEVSPLDRSMTQAVRLAVLGLNLLRPLRETRSTAVTLLSDWLKTAKTPR